MTTIKYPELADALESSLKPCIECGELTVQTCGAHCYEPLHVAHDVDKPTMCYHEHWMNWPEAPSHREGSCDCS